VPFNVADQGDGSIPGGGTCYLDGGDYVANAQLPDDPSKSGLPLMQVLTCVFTDASTDFSFPVNGAAFFDFAATTKCPPSWRSDPYFPYGFALMPNEQAVLDKKANPVIIGQAINHSHFSGPINVRKPGNADFCGSSLGAGPADSNQLTVSGNSSTSSSLPYLSLLTCEKIFNTSNDPYPPGLLVFSADCNTLDNQLPAPTWVPYYKFDGRFIVSAPLGGNPSGSFGSGVPLTAGSSNIYNNLHSHAFNFENPIKGRQAFFNTINECGVCIIPNNPPFQCNMHQPGCADLQVQGGNLGNGAWVPPFVQLQLCIQMP
jgi:hypothetical protein